MAVLPKNLNITKNVVLSDFTTLEVGGPAKYFTDVQDKNQLLDLLTWARDEKLPVFVLGGGSNIVVSDDGFDGLVLHMVISGITVVEDDPDNLLVEVGAGVAWDDFVDFAVTRNVFGVECLSGIPGSVGASPVQNIGAYGQEAGDTICKVHAVDLDTLGRVDFSNKDCKFAYRNSVFKQNPKYVITSVVFQLAKQGEPNIEYKSLKACFEDGLVPSLQSVREAVIKLRKERSTFLDATDPNTKSVGSFFVNPVMGARQLGSLKEKVGEDIPSWDAPDGKVKLPAAWLIEHAGFSKGYDHGNTGLSDKHTLILVNKKGATATEILEFAGVIQTTVREKYGITLAFEPTLV